MCKLKRTLAKSFASCPPALMIAEYASYRSATQHKYNPPLLLRCDARLDKVRLQGEDHCREFPGLIKGRQRLKGD
jgi:hypothetical protein